MSAVADKPSEIARAIMEIRKFTEVVTVLLNRPDSEETNEAMDIAPVVVPSPEITDILQEMRKLSSAAVSILNRPVERNVTPAQPAPNVTVLPPSVTVSPNVVVERNNTRFRVVVTAWALPPGSPPGSQLRIQELIIEPIA